MSTVFGFSKRLFTSLMSTFDITSDLVNSLNFLGQNASAKMVGATFGASGASTNNNGTTNSHPHNTTVTYSPKCQFLNNYLTNFSENNNTTFNDRIEHYINANFVCSSEGVNAHVVWGALGIAIMFIPGLVSMVMYIFNNSHTKNKFRKGEYPHDLIVMLLMAMFPLTMIAFQFYSTFTCQGEVYQGYMAIGVALEAFLESFLQLILQTYTIFYGYEITNTQIAAICASFFFLSKASIDLDLEMYKHELSPCDIVKHFAIMLPGYAATIAFRVLSFSMTMAFLRMWSIIPMCLLFLELSVAYYVSFKYDKDDLSRTVPIIITNLGVTNVGMLGAKHLINEEQKQNSGDVKIFYEDNDKFMKLSSTLSFIHHFIVVTAILGLVLHNPCYFEHWACPKFILSNYDGFFHDYMYLMVGGILGLGLFGLASMLKLGARSLRIVQNQLSLRKRQGRLLGKTQKN